MPRRKPSLADQIAALTNPAPTEADPEDFEHSGDQARLEEYSSDEDAVGNDFGDVTDLRKRADSTRLLEMDNRYAGRRVRRKDLGMEADDPESEFESAESDEESDSQEDSEEEDDSEEEGDSEEEEEEDDSDGQDEDDYDSDNEGDEALAQYTGVTQAEVSLSEQMKRISEQDTEKIALVSQTSDKDRERGIATRHQLQLQDSFLETRIRLQSLLTLANRFPRTMAFTEMMAVKGNEELAKSMGNTRKSLGSVVDTMLELQSTLLGQFEETESLVYSEGKRGKKRKAEEKEDEGEEEEGRVWGQIEGQHEQLRGWIRTTIEQCSARAQMASGGGGGSTGTAMHAKRFKAINQSTMAQIDRLLQHNHARLMERAQTRRSNDRVLCETAQERKALSLVSSVHADGSGGGREGAERREAEFPVDTEQFDDSDFFQSLLRVFVERSQEGGGGALAGGGGGSALHAARVAQQQATLAALRRKMKKVVDRRASKGRKIRYHVHEKLVDFMVPDSFLLTRTHNDTARSEMISSLFQ